MGGWRNFFHLWEGVEFGGQAALIFRGWRKTWFYTLITCVADSWFYRTLHKKVGLPPLRFFVKKRAKWNLTFVASLRAFDSAESQGVVVDFVLGMRVLAQVSVLTVLDAYCGNISVATTRNRQISKLTFWIKERTSNFVIGMRKPALANTSAGLIA